MADARSVDELIELCSNAAKQGLPIFILGGGSNLIVRDEGFPGLVIRNRIKGFEAREDTPSHLTISVGAGEVWDDVVKRTVDMNLTGIEALSAIPGTMGGAPVQNIGAYGQEVAESIVSVDVYDLSIGKMMTLQNEECRFSYRHSIFRGEQAGRYVIVSVLLKLYKQMPQPPFYKDVQAYFDAQNITLYTPQAVRDAVMAIRQKKLPDPAKQPNAGSFFKNAIVEDWRLEELKEEYVDIPHYDMGNKTYKVPTGWLIEQVGMKGKTLSGMKVHDNNALVLINESAQSYQELAAARDEIIGLVRDTFHINIEQEPLEI